jgi:hypothetical protein
MKKTISPIQSLIPLPIFLPDNVPFTEGRELAVDLHISDRGIHDMYIDDLISIAIDLPNSDNILLSERAPLLAIHACSHPNQMLEPTPRHPMVSRLKLEAKAALSKTKRIHGWDWDLRCLVISLPSNKFIAWSQIIKNTIESGFVSAKEFKAAIGRLNHLALVVPFVNHFLSRLRKLLSKSMKYGGRRTKSQQIALMISIL